MPPRHPVGGNGRPSESATAQADPLLALTQLYAWVTLNALRGLGFSADDGGGFGWPRAPLAGRSDGIRCPMLSCDACTNTS